MGAPRQRRKIVIGTDLPENFPFLIEIEVVWLAFYRDSELNPFFDLCDDAYSCREEYRPMSIC